MVSFVKKEAGLFKPPSHLLKKMTEITQGVLADYVTTRIITTTVPSEEVYYLQDSYEDFEVFYDDFNNSDMGELYSDLEMFGELFEGIHKLIINDPYRKKSYDDDIVDHSNNIKYKIENLLYYGKKDSYGRLREMKDVFVEFFKSLKTLQKLLTMKLERDAYLDKNHFLKAVSRYPKQEKLRSGGHDLDDPRGVQFLIEEPNFEYPLLLVVEQLTANKRGGGNYIFDIENDRHIVRVYIDIYPHSLFSKSDLQQVADTVRHELVHVMQEEMGLQLMLADKAGLPSKKRDDFFSQHNIDGEEELREDMLELGLSTDDIDFHALDDVEFYSRLLDEVEGFKRSHPRPTNQEIHEHINNSSFFRPLRRFKKKNWSKAIGLFFEAVSDDPDVRVATRIIQDLAGVKTWVDKTRQDQVQNDTSSPEPSRSDYQDGKPQRDRVLPLPSGHPKGRDEQRVGPPVSNTPSDSSGASLNYSMRVNPNAIPNQPDGKPLHQRPRSSGFGVSNTDILMLILRIPQV